MKRSVVFLEETLHTKGMPCDKVCFSIPEISTVPDTDQSILIPKSFMKRHECWSFLVSIVKLKSLGTTAFWQKKKYNRSLKNKLKKSFYGSVFVFRRLVKIYFLFHRCTFRYLHPCIRIFRTRQHHHHDVWKRPCH